MQPQCWFGAICCTGAAGAARVADASPAAWLPCVRPVRSITDAAHLLSDVSGFAVAVLAAIWAKRRASSRFSFGYHRIEARAGGQ